MRGVKLFCLIAFSYSWIIFIIVDIFILPGLFRAGDTAKVWLIALFGHMLAMAGPALASAILWKFYHKEHFPRWKWSRPKYYLLAAGSMLAIWTLPSLLGLIFGNTLSLRSPVETFAWVVIGASFSIGWLAGLGEETGWTAYLLPRLAPRMGKSRALIAAGMIRGLWHIPVLIGPRVAQTMAGEITTARLAALSVIFVFQLVVSNALFGALFGSVWYKTESLPLLGWMHQWFDAARDVTALMVIGYAGSAWFTIYWGIPFYLAAGLFLTQTARDEGANMWTLAPPRNPA